MEVRKLRTRNSPRVTLALAGLFLTLGSSIAQAALTATLTTDRGCGSSATYQNGETIRVSYSVSEAATVTITLTRPDGFVLRPVFQQFVPAGVTREYSATVGGVSGPRQLFLDAFSASEHASVECIYFGTGGPPFPPPSPPPSPLTAQLETNKGCGTSAVFSLGDQTIFRYRVSKSALVTLRLQRPDGIVSTLLANQPVAAGVTGVITGVIGAPLGQRLLILDAVAGSETAQQQCTYAAQGAPGPGPGPQTLTVSVDRNCGSTYRVGEQVTILYRSSFTTTVTLRLLFPNGAVRNLVENQPVIAGQTYATVGVAGQLLGTRTLTLSGAAPAGGTPPADATCIYTVTP
jgi:hypothetical protein